CIVFITYSLSQIQMRPGLGSRPRNATLAPGEDACKAFAGCRKMNSRVCRVMNSVRAEDWWVVLDEFGGWNQWFCLGN
ncbi:MAG TPA: hypothetical protein VK327_14300, partial [Candidatus Paceibacterota bacterium]|nr:hypothetical protein [Candidatus Paceibacterota bacterium]